MSKYLTFLCSVAFLATGCNENNSNQNKSQSTTQNTHEFFIANHSSKAFSKPIKNLTSQEETLFFIGRSSFKTPWVEAPSITTARDGLGPLFSANTCRHCHPNNGAGVALNKKGTMSRSLLLRLSHNESNNSKLLEKNGFEADSTYGTQLSNHSNAKVKAEGMSIVNYAHIKGVYPDGSSYVLRKPNYSIKNLAYGELDAETIIAPRIGSALIGLGLLEQISEKDLLFYEDINDSNQDGISGKANYAYSLELNKTVLSRFTWKAAAPSVKHQSAAAAHNDMGLSNPLFPQHNCTEKQKECLEQAKKGVHAFDLPEYRLNAVAFYLKNLAIPKKRNVEQHTEGQKLFKQLNCVACHVPTYVTSNAVKISPYSDLLLHDMGEELADGRSEFLATGKEWRTPPMWGIGLYKMVSGEANYLHDGRARSIEEAILWHGGEAKKSKTGFMALNKESRQKVLNFLNSI